MFANYFFPFFPRLRPSRKGDSPPPPPPTDVGRRTFLPPSLLTSLSSSEERDSTMLPKDGKFKEKTCVYI